MQKKTKFRVKSSAQGVVSRTAFLPQPTQLQNKNENTQRNNQ
jgi:hypothetical protein